MAGVERHLKETGGYCEEERETEREEQQVEEMEMGTTEL
jgi:hypothetical protein